MGTGQVRLRGRRVRCSREAPVRVLLPAPPGHGARRADRGTHDPDGDRGGRAMTAPASTTSVTVVVPALNEERDIVGCLEAIAAQTFPSDRVEVILVDSGSADATVATARGAADDLGLAAFAVRPNPRRWAAAAMNVGMREARGDLIVRVDARARIQPT